MDAAVWISILVTLLLLAAGLWLLLLATSVLVEPGTLALLLKRGKATSRALDPGRHFMQPWRKAMMQVYPSRELALVAGGETTGDPRVDATDAPLRVHLGDKTLAQVSYTVRCRLDITQLKSVHEQFGPEGIWSALRDTTRRSLIAEVGKPDVSIDDVFGDRYAALEQRLATALGAALGDIGFELTMFSLREIDLGETGEVIQATLRAAVELEREQALAPVRQARLENDASMSELLDDVDADVMLRYRQIEALAQILERWGGDRPIPSAISAPVTAAAPSTSATSTTSAQDAVDVEQQAEVGNDLQ
jgi:regulator of protease activity HflC (stomatin/prohibitin superfamily)